MFKTVHTAFKAAMCQGSKHCSEKRDVLKTVHTASKYSQTCTQRFRRTQHQRINSCRRLLAQSTTRSNEELQNSAFMAQIKELRIKDRTAHNKEPQTCACTAENREMLMSVCMLCVYNTSKHWTQNRKCTCAQWGDFVRAGRPCHRMHQSKS